VARLARPAHLGLTVIRTLQELFEHRLRTMLWIEQTLATELLPALRERVHAPQLKRGLERHLLETEGHVEVLRRLAGNHGVESAALVGVKTDLDLLAAEIDSPVAADLAHAAAMAQTEHLEIAAYESLAAAAAALGDEETALELREILEQEQYALEEVERAQLELLAVEEGLAK
jgi:ferritin-like metal-binding protein YciE